MRPLRLTIAKATLGVRITALYDKLSMEEQDPAAHPVGGAGLGACFRLARWFEA
jgi:hypothetical protein